ncbi:MAG: sulfotransferase, partial [Nitrospirae bacterium]
MMIARNVNVYEARSKGKSYHALLRRPWLINAINTCGEWLHHVGLSYVELNEEILCDRACAETGLHDFGDDAFREPLRILLRAYRTEAKLTFIGKLGAWHDTLRLLKNRLLLIEDRKRYPAIAKQEIRKPIFIVGLPRTGSTLLHNLFAQDPANRVPWTWEVMFPSPPPGQTRVEEDPRIAQTDTLLRRFDSLAPTFKTIHPMQANWPTECVGILSHTFASSQFQSTYHIPSYQQWWLSENARAAYEFHYRFLQHLQWGVPGER